MEEFGWRARDYAVGHERTVASLGDDGTTLSVDVPLVDAIEEAWNWQHSCSGFPAFLPPFRI